jgi:selenide,water dikinase
MAKASRSVSLKMSQVPLLGDSYRLVGEDVFGISFSNLEFVENDAHFGCKLDYNLKMIAMDAQTSGGLLMSVAPGKAEQLIGELHSSGLTRSAVIGYVTEKREKFLYLED